MKIVVDVYGGDNAPDEVIEGCLLAISNNTDLTVCMVGKEEYISNYLINKTYNKNQIEIINAEDVITNEDSPTLSIKNKTESSLVKAFDKVKSDAEVGGMVSAGSTGAVLTGSLLKVGRIKGVLRPALSPILPTVSGGKVLLVDSGANMDCKPEQLLHFAIMGSAYMKNMFNIENPRVALLNVGTEDKKGNDLCKQTFPLLKDAPINFVGNMEARDFLSGEYDVVVADGFWGNILLKSSEGAIFMVLKLLKKELKKSVRTKVGALLCKPAFKNLKSVMDYSEYGGAPFLGIKKVIVKAHGSSKAKSFAVAINQAYQMSKSSLNESIENEIKKVLVVESDE